MLCNKSPRSENSWLKMIASYTWNFPWYRFWAYAQKWNKSDCYKWFFQIQTNLETFTETIFFSLFFFSFLYLNVHLILSSNITGPADLPNKLKCNLYALCITIFINPQLSSPSQFASTSYPIHRQTLANSLKRLLNWDKISQETPPQISLLPLKAFCQTRCVTLKPILG